jgi:hypothetical protein
MSLFRRAVIPALILFVVLVSGGQANGQTATITNVNIYKETTGNPPAFIVEITGTNLLLPETPRVLVFPSAGTTITVLDTSVTVIHAEVTAPQDYAPTEIALSYSTRTVSRATSITSCNTDEEVKREFFYVPFEQASKKYSRGVATNFDVIQISIVNECPLPVLIPLAGIYLPDLPNIHAFSLDHVTSIYSNYHQFAGGRAIYFNILQAAATIGSAIEPFFAHGFTQGVSILGGGFTQASAAIWKDLSAEQLQNLASQSYQSTEQVGPNGGSLQKFIFLPKKDKKDKSVQKLFAGGQQQPEINMEIIPVVRPGS